MFERERPTKISFVGTSSVGKTALVDEYRKRFFNSQVAIVEEEARKFFTQNPQIQGPDRFLFEPQSKIQALVLQKEKDAHSSGARVIICDRSVIDAVVYVKNTGDSEGAKILLDRVEFWLPTYDKFLLLNPADVLYKKDDVRQEDETVRQKLHEGFVSFFNETGIPYELLSGTVEQRIARVDEIINE